MRLSLSPQQIMAQRQILAPRMIQSMEILQLPQAALEERIEQELAENPLLEMRDSDPSLPDEPIERDEPREKSVDEKEIIVDDKNNNADDFERLLNLDRDVPDHFDESPRRSANRVDDDGDRQHDLIANVAERPESLQDFLMGQLHELDLRPELLAMCERIISTLDPADGGYFRTALRDLLPPDASQETVDLAEEALKVVQSLDPPGIAARDLRECLLAQITPKMDLWEEVRTLVSKHLEDLRDNRLPQVQKATGMSLERIQDAWDQLRTLNPRPGSRFAEQHTPTVTPDVFLERTDDGKYKVIVEEGRIPQLFISKYYRERLASGNCTAEEKEFIKRKVNAAQWLIESIQQRRNTLMRVSQAIVDHQWKFIDEGPEFIQPLKMEEIANIVGVHVTTVSRAVDEKYIQTPRGILPLKRFFVGGTRSEEGEDVAWDIIRIKLQEIVDKEDKKNPLSDDELVTRLKEQGLNVARRTITKYRQKMGIPSSRQRRDWSMK